MYSNNMEVLIDKDSFQSAICIIDNKLYIYRNDEAICSNEEDYTIVRCFLVTTGRPDFSKVIEIYGKDLVNSDLE